MPTLLDIERAAARLRRDLRVAHIPALRILCGLRLFALFGDAHTPGLESYIREFIPPPAQAGGSTNHAWIPPRHGGWRTGMTNVRMRGERMRTRWVRHRIGWVSPRRDSSGGSCFFAPKSTLA